MGAKRYKNPGPTQRVEEAKNLREGAFGPSVGVKLTTEVSAYTERAEDSRVWKQFQKLGGSVAVTAGEAVLSTGATQYAYSVLQTVQQSAYLPGKGMRYAFTARFPDGEITNGFQVVGPFHGEAGFGVGFPGTGSGFGFMHRRGRRFEVQVLQVTVAASGAETVTLTLNDAVQSGAAVTAGTVQQNAKEIAEAVAYSDSGGLVDYDAYSLGDKVYLIRQTHGVVSGAFSISSTGTCDGSFSQFQAGAAGTQTWVYQSDWDDPCDGGGASGITLDPTVGNVYLITYGWLGYLGPTLWVADPEEPRMVPVHFLPWAGTASATSPSVADPRFPIIYSAASLGSTTDFSVAGASCYVALEGDLDIASGPIVTESNRKTGVGTSEVPVASMMTSPVEIRHNVINRRRVVIESVAVANVGSKDAEIRIYVGEQSNLVGSVFASTDDDQNVWTDTSATALTGTLDEVAAFDLPAGAEKNGPLHDEGFVLYRGQVLIVTAQTTASTTEVFVSITAHEDP